MRPDGGRFGKLALEAGVDDRRLGAEVVERDDLASVRLEGGVEWTPLFGQFGACGPSRSPCR